MCVEAQKNGREGCKSTGRQRKARRTDCGVSQLIPAKVNGVAPGFTLRFPAWCAKPSVPKVAIYALHGYYCFISSLSAVNSNPRPHLCSQDQSHKDVCPCTGLWHVRGHICVFVLGPSWERNTSLWPRQGFMWRVFLQPVMACSYLLWNSEARRWSLNPKMGGLKSLKQVFFII